MFSGYELAIVAVVVVLLFGSRLPGAAKSLGQSFGSFKNGLKEGSEDEKKDDDASGKVDGPTF